MLSMKSNQLKVLNMTIENPKHEGEIAKAAHIRSCSGVKIGCSTAVVKRLAFFSLVI